MNTLLVVDDSNNPKIHTEREGKRERD